MAGAMHKMATPSRSPGPLANKVCLNCKLRKKKCDKTLPSCGYCADKGFQCQYNHDYPSHAFIGPNPHFLHLGEVSSAEAALSHEAKRIIGATGQFLDEISVRYFQGFHTYLPVMSRQRFHDMLLSFSSDSHADFSILLLSMCLVTYCPRPRQETKPLDMTALFLATKSLFSQAQALGRPSLTLIQAGFILAVFEYARGEPEHAFISIGAVGRMAYAANIKHPCSLPSRVSTDGEINALEEEHGNTWWGILLAERVFMCELDVLKQPIVSTIPRGVGWSGSPAGPYEGPSPSSRAVTVYLDGFRQATLATCLLDQMLGVLSAPSPEPNLAYLNDLDRNIQSFLTSTMHRYPVASGVHCGGITLSIRGLFAIHRQILVLLREPSSQFECPKEAYGTSRAALDTVTKIVADVAESRQHLAPYQMDALPPTYIYLARAGLSYINDECKPLPAGSWMWAAEKQLQQSLESLHARWNGIIPTA
ncbi:hypothetical protein BDV18DRAFT_146724 [Aspergillus unguis]